MCKIRALFVYERVGGHAPVAVYMPHCVKLATCPLTLFWADVTHICFDFYIHNS